MSHDVDVLNRLIVALRGAAGGYRRAGADGPGLSDVFGAAADAHDRTAEELATVVRALDGAPAEGGGVDPVRHAWADLPRAVARGERATAEAVERAEAELIADLQAVIDDGAVSEPVRDAAVRALDEVKADRRRALQRLDTLGG